MSAGEDAIGLEIRRKIQDAIAAAGDTPDSGIHSGILYSGSPHGDYVESNLMCRDDGRALMPCAVSQMHPVSRVAEDYAVMRRPGSNFAYAIYTGASRTESQP